MRLPERYEDLGPLGAGGMAEVRRVRDRHVGRAVAMKILAWHAVDRPDLADRFRREIAVTALLEHPAVIPLHDWGVLPDGRPWFTMPEVRGRTLTGALAEAADPLVLRRLAGVVAVACDALAHAHDRGVVHRDIKPDNILLGPFGEIHVVDWGIAGVDGMSEILGRSDEVGPGTMAGTILGTPPWLSPEQARGALAVGPSSDVYGVGAILYALLAVRPPYEAHGERGRRAVIAGPPPTLVGGDPELERLCHRAMDRDPAARPGAAEVAETLRAWLDGARRLERARAALADAETVAARTAALRAEEARLRQEATELLRGVAEHAPVEAKVPAWEAADRADALAMEAGLEDARMERGVHGALQLFPQLPSARALLAGHHRQRSEAARDRGDEVERAHHRALVAAWDDGTHAAWLGDRGRLQVRTRPAGAVVERLRFVPRARRLTEVSEGEPGGAGQELARGSYVLVASAPGHATVRVPVVVAEDPVEVAIDLPPTGALGPDDVLVTGGWFASGGDRAALDALSARRVWVDSFVIRRLPVTNREFLVFLAALDEAGRGAEAESHAPVEAVRGSTPRPVFERGPQGWRIVPDPLGQPWHLDEPVVLVDWHAAMAFAAWTADQTGLPWRLPHSQEWEKAARGVDGRPFPWGSWLDPTWCVMQASHAGAPRREVAGSRPGDVSAYGVRDLAGNTRDWCLDDYERDGPASGALGPIVAGTGEYRVIRGGSYSSVADRCRAAGRFAARPEQRLTSLGFRLARSGVSSG